MERENVIIRNKNIMKDIGKMIFQLGRGEKLKVFFIEDKLQKMKKIFF